MAEAAKALPCLFADLVPVVAGHGEPPDGLAHQLRENAVRIEFPVSRSSGHRHGDGFGDRDVDVARLRTPPLPQPLAVPCLPELVGSVVWALWSRHLVFSRHYETELLGRRRKPPYNTATTASFRHLNDPALYAIQHCRHAPEQDRTRVPREAEWVGRVPRADSCSDRVFLDLHGYCG